MPPVRLINEHATKRLDYAKNEPPAMRCETCRGAMIRLAEHVSRKGRHYLREQSCPDCNGIGFHGIRPELPTTCVPGTNGKMAVMATRYEAGFPVFNRRDYICTGRE